jgi:ribosomal protein S18 acetylase RimI-like enzyme
MSQTNWSLRLARPDDAEAMPYIEAQAAKLFDQVEGLESLSSKPVNSVEQLQRYIRKSHCLVAHVDQAMAGFLVNQPFSRELHIWELSVDPAFHRRGIGAGLVRACQIDAHNTGFKALTLTTFRDVEWNGPFYRQLGFDEVTALDAHPRLANELALEADNGMPMDRRCAMIHFLS